MHVLEAVPEREGRQDRVPRANWTADPGQIGKSAESVKRWESLQTLVESRHR